MKNLRRSGLRRRFFVSTIGQKDKQRCISYFSTVPKYPSQSGNLESARKQIALAQELIENMPPRIRHCSCDGIPIGYDLCYVIQTHISRVICRCIVKYLSATDQRFHCQMWEALRVRFHWCLSLRLKSPSHQISHTP